METITNSRRIWLKLAIKWELGHFVPNLRSNDQVLPISLDLKKRSTNWGITPTGHFSVNFMYRAIAQANQQKLSPVNTLNRSTSHNWSWIRKLPIPPKVKSFMWILQHNRLPTQHFLHSIGIIPSNVCQFFHTGQETTTHIFLLYWHSVGLHTYTKSFQHWVSPKD